MDRMPMPPGGPERVTLREAKRWLSDRLSDGAHCPCCGQIAKVYRRKVNSTMARALIQLYRHGGTTDFVHAPSLPGDTHEMSQLSWWGLIEEERIRREDGGRAGWWKLTERGALYVTNRLQIQEYAVVYDGTLVRLEGQLRSIQAALGKRFNLRDLMS